VTLLRNQPGLRVPEIAKRLKTSEGTVRNDLKALAAEGQVTRVRGGAVLVDDSQPHSSVFAARVQVNQAAKLQIASQAAKLIQDGDSILLDASSTVYGMARYLRQACRNLTVVTNGIEVARALAQNPSNTVILLGGVLDPAGISIKGALSEPLLKELHIKTAFVSCRGLTLDAGLTEMDLDEAQLKSKMIASAEWVVALVDSTKFGAVGLTPFARIEQLAHVFVDNGLSAHWIERLKQARVAFTLCEG
jgi:DeoR/GlpR family transcriptional regulator of sugar metabolism